MKRNLLFILSFCLAFIASNLSAQVRPDEATHQKHLWNFEDDTADDLIGDAHGELFDGAEIYNGILDLDGIAADAKYLQLPADIIQINTYDEISVEIWATPNLDVNNGQALMMWSFGTYGNPGFRYFFFTPQRWDNNVASRISIGNSEPWANENGINETMAIADASLHHYVLTINDLGIMTLYVDGAYTFEAELSPDHNLAAVDAVDAFIGRSMYSADPTWKGTVELYSIWDAALTEEEVKWLFEKGEKRGLPVGINDVKQSVAPLNFYESNNRLFVKNAGEPILSLSIYSITGSMVYQNNKFQSGDYVNLKHGIYIVKSNNHTQKIVVK
jgi:hypothetical protein